MSNSDDDKTQIAFKRPNFDKPLPDPPAAGAPEQARRAPRPGLRPQVAQQLNLEELKDWSGSPLLDDAMPLLLLAAQLRHTVAHNDVAGMRRECAARIHAFEQGAGRQGYDNKIVSAARYALCTLIDEAVMKTPWGGSSSWSAQTLLMQFHGETWGGEKFFQILERVSQDPESYRDLIELYYFCMALGLVGRFGVEAGGEAQLNEIKDRAFRLLMSRRAAPSDELSPHWRGLEEQGNPVARSIPAWVWGMLCLVLVIGSFLWFRSLLVTGSQPVAAGLAQVGLEPYVPGRTRVRRPETQVPEPPPPPPVTLASVLGKSPISEKIIIEEIDSRTNVAVSFSNLFASARADVNPEYDAMWSEIARAIEQVPGRVIVVGHTDDLPLKSLRYKDNFELSKERAIAVAKILSSQISNPARIQYSGVGPSRPRFLPANQRENRARNRRVEISHWAEEQ